MLTKQQIAWAKQHDWYYSDHLYSVRVLERNVTESGIVYEEFKTFHDFKELRNWAGY